ncbi:MAG TPA: DUF1003 domain-containing protein [Steroidobacteraceae bacterium]|nr:DUF1003 domain-containing protein [Steroidobacteraceae bacterium]
MSSDARCTTNDAAKSATAGVTADGIPEHITHNIDSIVDFHNREELKISDSQRRLEYVGSLIGRPLYLLAVIYVAVFWILMNALAPRFGLLQVDPPPFFWLQGVLGLGAFLTTTIVLITQNRQSQLTARRLNLDLQINLLTEQKTTKLIHLFEELRRDLPMVKNRHDAMSAAMQVPADTTQMLEALTPSHDSDTEKDK